MYYALEVHLILISKKAGNRIHYKVLILIFGGRVLLLWRELQQESLVWFSLVFSLRPTLRRTGEARMHSTLSHGVLLVKTIFGILNIIWHETKSRLSTHATQKSKMAEMAKLLVGPPSWIFASRACLASLSFPAK